MRLDLGADLLVQIRTMGREVEVLLPIGEMLTADAVLLPTSSIEAKEIYEPLWATTKGRWVTLAADGTIVARAVLPGAELFQEDAIQ